MPRIKCHYLDCVFLDESYCSAAAVEIDPDAGCTTYSPSGEVEAEEEWDDEEDEWDEDQEAQDDQDEEKEWDEEEEGLATTSSAQAAAIPRRVRMPPPSPGRRRVSSVR